MHVLIVKPSSFGDVVHAFPAVAMLQKLAPKPLKITWVVNDNLAMLPKMMPEVQRIIAFPRKNWRRKKAMRNFLRELRSEKYDLVIDFQGLLRSAMIAWMSKAPRKAGFQKAREGAKFFYNEKCRLDASCQHAVEKNIALVKMAFPRADGDTAGHAEHPVLTLPAEAEENAARLLPGKGEPSQVMAVAFSSRWPSKTWPKDFFASVMLSVSSLVPGLEFWLLGGSDEFELGNELAGLVSGCRVVNLAGKTDVPTLAALLRGSGVLLTNDSGPMHLAAAMGTRCVALFGATDPALTGPWGPPGQHMVVRSQCPMHPCFQRLCPRGKDVCPQGTDPRKVAEMLAEQLQAAKKQN